MCRVSHLKKFVYDKFEIDAQRFDIDIMYKVKTIVLLDYYTLMDIAYIYTWKRDAPMRFYFRVYQSQQQPAVKAPPQAKALPVVVAPLLKQEQVTPLAVEATTPALPALPALAPAPLSVKTPSPSPPARIKQEQTSPPTKQEMPQQQQQQQQDEFRIVPKLSSPTEQPLKLVINRNLLEKREKTPPSPKCAASNTPPANNKEEPNIKLKIDLSKQNSVTIINMSDPERKEIIKPLKPEKESRSKSKNKDKDGSPKSSSESRKRKSPSPLTVPPLTIRTERILSPNGVSTVLSPRVTSGAVEDPKSEFLKSFALKPIKLESPEKHQAVANGGSVAGAAYPAACSKSPLDDRLLMKPPSAMPPKSIASSKRKSKEPIKTVSKKPKLSPPLPREDFKIRLPTPNGQATPAPSSSAVDKPLMPPPASKVPLAAAVRHKAQHAVATPPAVPPFSPLSHQGLQLAPPGNRTPIAKRYQPILPKAARPNPFANIPSDVNRLLKDAGTEIKSIASQQAQQSKTHVYGPKLDQKMGPPATAPSVRAGQKPAVCPSPSSSSSSAQSKSQHSNNYLNLALFNSSKSKGKEAPPGCRTPMYTPNSPIYSPSSPQYVPNYNIPTMPTYKYTPKPATTTGSVASSNQASSYLQSMLNGAGGGAGGGLFPSPPVKTDQNTNPSGCAAEDAPEKQQVKVKSLLNSCNINIPSSLSITISRDNGDASSPSSGVHPKHKSPVNNYIEIVKLPDQSQTQSQCPEQKEQAVKPNKAAKPAPVPVKLPAPPSKTIPSPQHLLARMTPPQQQQQPQQPPAAPRVITPPKTSPTAAASAPPKPVLTPQQAEHSKKSTPSPEKRSAASAGLAGAHSPNSGENKSPKAGAGGGAAAGGASSNGDTSAAKKFRPILPRQNATPTPTLAPSPHAELQPKLPQVLPPNLSFPASNNVKKVPASKKSPGGAGANPSGGKLHITPPKSSPGARKAGKQPTPPPPSATPTPMPPSASAMGPPAPHLPTLNAPLSIASSANQLDLNNFFKENLMRAQAAAANTNLLFNYNPANLYSSYQHAYLMDQVFKDYLQKLKHATPGAGAGDAGGSDAKPVMPMLPTVRLPSPAASPKTSPLAGFKLQPAATPAALAKSGASPRPLAAASASTTTATSNGLSLAGKSK